MNAMRSAVLADRIGHTLLLTGPEGSCRDELALWLARLLLCREHTACGVCGPCVRALAGNHADLHLYKPEKSAKSLRVEDVEALQEAMALKAREGGRRVYILSPAETLTPQAQNKLLKTLEEPPDGAVLILLAARTAPLLPTVLSRCNLLRMQPQPPQTVEEALISRGIAPDLARDAARQSDGWPDRALALAQDEDFSRLMQLGRDTFAAFDGRGGPLRLLAMVQQSGFTPAQMLDCWAILLRDAVAGLVCPELKNLNQNELLGRWSACHQAQERLAGNANPGLTLDWLMCKWKGCDDLGQSGGHSL